MHHYTHRLDDFTVAVARSGACLVGLDRFTSAVLLKSCLARALHKPKYTEIVYKTNPNQVFCDTTTAVLFSHIRPFDCHLSAMARLEAEKLLLRCHAHPPLIPSCQCQLLPIIDSHTQTFCSCFRISRLSITVVHVESIQIVPEQYVCLVHVRPSRVRHWGEFTGVRKINNFLKCASPPLMSIRFDAELKEVPNEARPRGDVRLVTPRGPSASTIESLEKALQTVGRTNFLLHFPPFVLMTLLFQKLKGRFKV